MSYPIPEKTTRTKLVIKKSRFIAMACFTDSRERAMNCLAMVKNEHSDARHHCWAYLLGNSASPTSAAMSDDGEPSGTAGKPILNVLQHKDVGDIMVIVTRYFGGIKLGAGGLVRAYSAATQQVMDALPLRQWQATVELNINCQFQHEQAIRHWLAQHQASSIISGYPIKNTDCPTVNPDYPTATNNPDVCLQVTIPEIFRQSLADYLASCGADVSHRD